MKSTVCCVPKNYFSIFNMTVYSITVQKILVMSGLITCSFCDGYIFGQMSGMLTALQAQDSEIRITDEAISWIASIINVTCFCGFAIAVFIADKFGRRKALSVLSSPILLSWIMVYYARNGAIIIISRIIVGTCFGGVLFLLFITTAEYSAANTRGLCMNLVTSVGPSLGTGVGHVLSTVLSWRTVALIGIGPSVIAVLLPLFWVESPSWLASNGRFEECKSSFRALHGHSIVTEQQLSFLIDTESLKQLQIAKRNKKSYIPMEMLKFVIGKKYFWKLILMSFIISTYRTAGGKMLFNTFAITILQDLTGSHKILFFTLLVDALVLLGSCLSCILINKMNMRSQLFPTAIIAIILLLTLAACIYFVPNDYSYFPWITSTLLGLYFIAINSGPYPILDALCGEIFPMELKSFLLSTLGIINGILVFLSIKLASQMFREFGYHGVYIIYALISIICLIYLWVYLPETKGRSLSEIEMYFKNNSFDKRHGLLRAEQIEELVQNT